MFCQGCGVEIKDGAAFCPKCGTSVRVATQGQPQVQAQHGFAVSQQAQFQGAPHVATNGNAVSGYGAPTGYAMGNYQADAPVSAQRAGSGARSNRGVVIAVIIVVVVVIAIIVGMLGFLLGSSKTTSDTPANTSSATVEVVETTPAANNTSNTNANAAAATVAPVETPAVDTGSFDIDNASHYATCNLFLDNFIEVDSVKSIDTSNPNMDVLTNWAKSHIVLNRRDLIESGSYNSMLGIKGNSYTGRTLLSNLSDAVSRYTGVALNCTKTTSTVDGEGVLRGDYYYFDRSWGTGVMFGLITSVTYEGNDMYTFTYAAYSSASAETESNGVNELSVAEANAKYRPTGTTGTATVSIGDPADESTYTLVRYTAA